MIIIIVWQNERIRQSGQQCWQNIFQHQTLIRIFETTNQHRNLSIKNINNNNTYINDDKYNEFVSNK